MTEMYYFLEQEEVLWQCPCILTQEKFGDNVPSRIIIANRSVPRLESAKELLKGLNPATKIEYIHNPTPADNDKTLASLKPHSLIVNATGLGKDAPGLTAY